MTSNNPFESLLVLLVHPFGIGLVFIIIGGVLAYSGRGRAGKLKLILRILAILFVIAGISLVVYNFTFRDPNF